MCKKNKQHLSLYNNGAHSHFSFPSLHFKKKKKKKHINAVILQSGVRNEALCTFLLTCITCGVVTQGSDLSHSTSGLTTGTELVLSIYSHPHTVGRVSVMKVLSKESMNERSSKTFSYPS